MSREPMEQRDVSPYRGDSFSDKYEGIRELMILKWYGINIKSF